MVVEPRGRPRFLGGREVGGVKREVRVASMSAWSDRAREEEEEEWEVEWWGKRGVRRGGGCGGGGGGGGEGREKRGRGGTEEEGEEDEEWSTSAMGWAPVSSMSDMGEADGKPGCFSSVSSCSFSSSCSSSSSSTSEREETSSANMAGWRGRWMGCGVRVRGLGMRYMSLRRVSRVRAAESTCS